MRKLASIFLLAIPGLFLLAQVNTQTGQAGSTGTADPGDRPTLAVCALNAWSPEIFTFYGDKASIIEKLNSIDRNLLEHRSFGFIVEDGDRASAYFFEGQTLDSREHSLSYAESAAFKGFANRVSATLLTNQGDKCAGMLTKDLLNSSGVNMQVRSVERPDSIARAYSLIDQMSADYVRVTFILLC
jgi:hypothetical protein